MLSEPTSVVAKAWEQVEWFRNQGSNHRHFSAAADALVAADPEWLEGLITRRVPMQRWGEALERRPDDIKTIVEFPPAGESS